MAIGFPTSADYEIGGEYEWDVSLWDRIGEYRETYSAFHRMQLRTVARVVEHVGSVLGANTHVRVVPINKSTGLEEPDLVVSVAWLLPPSEGVVGKRVTLYVDEAGNFSDNELSNDDIEVIKEYINARDV